MMIFFYKQNFLIKKIKKGEAKYYPLIISLSLLFGFYSTSIYAEVPQEYPLAISIGAHTLSVPWYPAPIKEKYNPAFIGGSEYTFKNSGNFRLYQTLNLGFFQHYWWMSGIFLNSEFGISYIFGLGIHLDFRIGMGYLHYFFRRETMEFRNGKYEKAIDWGRPSLMVPVSLMLGYRGSAIYSRFLSPFISMQWSYQGIFQEEISGLSHLMFFCGVRIFWGDGIGARKKKMDVKY